SARLIMRFGARAILLVGLTLIVTGLALFARSPLDASYTVDILPPMVLLGVGGGLSFPAVMSIGMSSATPNDSGLISGLIKRTAQMGGSVGLAGLATLAASRTDQPLAAGQRTSAALPSGNAAACIG